ncbi:MAG: hypothetical protein IJ881_00885, partial [Neisseriaceae bacterium]|nr:hypothetical protein [Neisseriaceae bacterium]
MIETLKQKGVALSSVSEFLPHQAQQLATAIAILHKKLGTPRPLT